MSTGNLETRLDNVSAVRTLIDSINDYMNAADQTDDDSIRMIWSSYCDICLQANQRLGECAELIDNGCWYEAVRLAEVEPDLLNVIGQLDFECREAWEQMGVDYGWRRLATVVFDRAESLHEAYEIKRKLNPLIRKHIQLAIARAPLNERLGVMRELSEKDSLSTYWRADVEEFERVRFREIDRLVDHALHHDDYELLVDLIGEFSVTKWIARPTKKLAEKLRSVEADYLSEVALPGLGECLVDAYRIKELDQAIDLRYQWDDALSRLRNINPAWQMSSELSHFVSAPMDWLAGVDAEDNSHRLFEEAINRLLLTCDQRKVKLSQLKIAEQQVLNTGFNVPDDVRGRLNDARMRAMGAAFLEFFGVIAFAFVGLAVVYFLFLKDR